MAGSSDLEGTLHQGGEAQAASLERSLPKEAVQHPEAPRLAGYVLVHPLGRGSFAQVWKGWQSRTRKWVAVKVFTRKTGVDWLFLQREVERLIRLDKHPHIVSLLDADLAGETPYYVMDLLSGGSLERYVDPKGPATVEQAARWMEEICQALAYVHAKGLIHCDLKPANVMLDEEGRVRVADFGQSRVLSESSAALGTLFYMAPEQAVMPKDGEQAQPDVRWDVYALGATIYAVLTGGAPHGSFENRRRLEAAGGLEERLAWYRQSVQSRPLQHCAESTHGRVDEDLAAIVAKCMLADMSKRHATAAEAAADLAARREGRPVSLFAGGGRPYRLQKWMTRNPLATLGLVLGAFLAAAAVGEFLSGKRESEELETMLVRQRILDAEALAGRVRELLLSQHRSSPSDRPGFARAVGERRPALETLLRKESARPAGLIIRGRSESPVSWAPLPRLPWSMFRQATPEERGPYQSRYPVPEWLAPGVTCAAVVDPWLACVAEERRAPREGLANRYLMSYWWMAGRLARRELSGDAGLAAMLVTIPVLGAFFAILTLPLVVAVKRFDPRLGYSQLSATLERLEAERIMSGAQTEPPAPALLQRWAWIVVGRNPSVLLPLLASELLLAGGATVALSSRSWAVDALGYALLLLHAATALGFACAVDSLMCRKGWSLREVLGCGLSLLAQARTPIVAGVLTLLVLGRWNCGLPTWLSVVLRLAFVAGLISRLLPRLLSERIGRRSESVEGSSSRTPDGHRRLGLLAVVAAGCLVVLHPFAFPLLLPPSSMPEALLRVVRELCGLHGASGFLLAGELLVLGSGVTAATLLALLAHTPRFAGQRAEGSERKVPPEPGGRPGDVA